MSDDKKPIRASKEVIWHLTCGGCGNYWTYPTMQMDQDITKLKFHCPVCGMQRSVELDAPLG